VCGIVGLVRERGPAREQDTAAVAVMRDSLTHRGPDDAGLETLGRCVLGHRRLSIVDLGTGQQPMSDPEKRAWVVFNGEIYNHLELRAELEAKGHRFRTSSDTEVLVHLYLAEGVSFLERLEGMYALALWDVCHERLLLARDPMGQKPLFWTRAGGSLLFSSELKGLLAHPAVPRKVDRKGVRLYLRHDCVPAPHTIYEGTKKLEAGTHLLFEVGCGEPQAGRHHALPLDAADLRDVSPEEARERLWEALVRAVERRLMSDVPLGVFLSGGIDSTVVVAAMAECLEASRIRTFTVGFEERSYDESEHARVVAERFGTEHSEEILAPEVALSVLPEVLGILDEPFADHSIVPTWLLSRFTRRHVTVALGGDGGDELFMGYPTFFIDKAARIASILPRLARSGLPSALARLLPVSDANMSAAFKMRRLGGGMALPWPFMHFAWITGLAPDLLDGVLQTGFSGDARDVEDESLAAVRETLDELRGAAASPLDLVAGLYARLYLGEDVLQKVDRASMAHSLEARAPFLDRDFHRLAFSLPARHKVSGSVGKAMLRRLVDRHGLPSSIVYRKKKGFGVPVAGWLKGPLRPLAEDLLLAPDVAATGVLEPVAVKRLFEDHVAGRADHRKELWSLLVYRAWERGPYGPTA
jgi:asparagine synthase (glutamine-hydrolysing)